MKRFLLIAGIFLFGVYANAAQIGVLPVPTSNENAYGLENISNIIAKELVSADKNFVPERQKQGLKLKNIIPDKTKTVNLRLVKNLSSNDKTLIITSYINDNDRLFDVWDILKISTDFNIEKSYTMEVKTILTDNKDGVILWQKTFTMPLGVFSAQNMTEACDKKEKITSYARNIISPDISQNINLRLNDKKIDYSARIQKSENSRDGIGLKYKNNAPLTKIHPADDDNFEERWRNDDSFNL